MGLLPVTSHSQVQRQCPPPGTGRPISPTLQSVLGPHLSLDPAGKSLSGSSSTSSPMCPCPQSHCPGTGSELFLLAGSRAGEKGGRSAFWLTTSARERQYHAKPWSRGSYSAILCRKRTGPLNSTEALPSPSPPSLRPPECQNQRGHCWGHREVQ